MCSTSKGIVKNIVEQIGLSVPFVHYLRVLGLPKKMNGTDT